MRTIFAAIRGFLHRVRINFGELAGLPLAVELQRLERMGPVEVDDRVELRGELGPLAGELVRPVRRVAEHGEWRFLRAGDERAPVVRRPCERSETRLHPLSLPARRPGKPALSASGCG